MSNSQIITHPFEFFEPSDLTEALQILRKEKARPLAGGTDLVNRLKDGREKPNALVYIGRLSELLRMEDGNPFVLGSAVPMRTVETHEVIRKTFPALAEAINSVGGMQIRNTATLAGNLANASPGADTTPALIAYGGELILVSAGDGGKVKERAVPVEAFFTGPGKTVLQAGELIREIRLPKPEDCSGGAFRKIARVTLDIAKINCAAYLERNGKVCTLARVVVGSAAPTAVRVKSVEKLFTGAEITEDLLRRAAAEAARDISPIDDVRSSREYRTEVAAVLVGDVCAEAWKRSGGTLA